MFRSLLVPVDLSPYSDRVLRRVALLPLAAQARITLLHVVSSKLPGYARKTAERDARRALDDEVADLTKALPEEVTIRRLVRVGAAADEIVACAKSEHADLIVMGRGGGRALRDMFLGSTAERVVRQATLPVLVVRLSPRTQYRRPALALELDPVAQQVVAVVPRMFSTPIPRVAIIHAYEAPYGAMRYPSLPADELEESLEYYRDKATREISKMLAAAFTARRGTTVVPPAWAMHVQHGSARTVIEKTVRKLDTDLLMLGTRASSGVARAFLGTVAGDALRSVACDVLVVPPSPSK